MVPPKKRTKLELNPLIQGAWEHYRNFVDSAEEGGGDDDEEDDANACTDGEGGDVDELLELIEMLTPMDLSPFDSSPSNKTEVLKSLGNIKSLLPILMSMSYLHLASYAISFTMFHPTTGKEDESGMKSPQYYFEQALHYWPTNPAAKSLHANYHRMNLLRSTDYICGMYVEAAASAHEWRGVALDFLQMPLESEDKEGSDDALNVKEWVELLIVNGALGVDYIADDEDEEEGAEDGGKDTEEEEDEDSGEYSFSEVEATASFMSALLLSTLGKHEEALPYLKKFELSHRIHPNVWKMAQSYQDKGTTASNEGNGKKDNNTLMTFEPRIYHGDAKNTTTSADEDYSEGVLPSTLYKRICSIFEPKAPYWDESDYNNRGYYSYFIDFDDRSNNGQSVKDRPTNVIEEVIVKHLLPLAERTLKEEHKGAPPAIVGAEWWCHTRALGANLGHQLHFDTDESLLGREKRVTHPAVSSVLYLTGGRRGKGSSKSVPSAGSTIVFNQTPESKEVASKAWIAHAKDNAFMNFPGDCLHGVLPCSGSRNGDSGKKQDNNRLTFMVGFWTRNVAKEMGNSRSLYGPCGPLPPATKEHSWVIESQNGYSNEASSDAANHRETSDIAFDNLPCAFPAWDQFETSAPSENTCSPSLVVPKGLDHRYFVNNAPHCFSQSLYEKDECF